MCHTPGYHSQNWNDDCPSLKIKGVPQKWSANYTHGCNSWTPGSCLINIVCTYWLSVKAGKGNIWLEVMTYEPRSVTSQHFLWQVDCVSIEYYHIERTTKLNASANWMAHQTEWLTFKLNDSSSNGPPNWMAHYWMIHFTIEWPTAHWMPGRTRGAWFMLGASLSQASFLFKIWRCHSV